MNTHEVGPEYNAELDVMQEPEFRRILGDLFDAIDQGEPTAIDRLARQHPRYAPALLLSAMHGMPADARARSIVVSAEDAAAAAGIQAAMNALGIASLESESTEAGSVVEEREAGARSGAKSPLTVLIARKERGWTLAELARRLLLPNGLVLKLERGQIVTWPRQLAARLAEALDSTPLVADSILRATAGIPDGPKVSDMDTLSTEPLSADSLSASSLSADSLPHPARARSLQHQVSYAFAAQGDPEVDRIMDSMRQTFDFEEELNRERLTPDQATYWKAGQ